MKKSSAWARTFLVVSICTMISKVVAVGDEHTYLQIFGDDKYQCEMANYGARVPTQGIVNKGLKVLEGCGLKDRENIPQDAFGSIIVLDYRNIHKHKDCSVFSDVQWLSANDFGGGDSPLSIPAIVVVNWGPNGTHPMQPGGHRYTTIVPSCMVSQKDGELIMKRAELLTTRATLEGGSSESVHFEVQNARILSVYIDGVSIRTDHAVIPDTWQRVAIHVERAELANVDSWFSMSVSDFTGTNLKWECAVTHSPPKDWNSDMYFYENDRSFTRSSLKEVSPMDDVADSKSWEKAGMRIWTEKESADLYCFYAKSYANTTKYGYQYSYHSDPVYFAEAEKRCHEEGGALVSIHSRVENDIVTSLIPKQSINRLGAFIGLNDIVEEKSFVWADRTAVDYTNWAADNPRSKGDEYDCVAIRKDDTTGLTEWENVRCDRSQRPFICKKFVGAKDATTDDDARCFLYLDDSMGSFSKIGSRPQPLIGANESTCVYGTGTSCCSASYVNDNIVTANHETEKVITDPKCKFALRQLNCFPCMASQGHYTSYDIDNGLVMNFCEDTCVTVFESCKNDPWVKSKLTAASTSKTFCQNLNRIHSAYGMFQIRVVESDEANCFRIDGLPPTIVTLEPPISGDFPPNPEVLKIKFDEQIRIMGGQLEIWPYEKNAKDVSKKTPLFTVNLMDSTHVSRTKTMYDFDTLQIELKDMPCLKRGKYELFIPSFSITDYAGNAFPGTTAEYNQWIVEVRVKNSCEITNNPGEHHHHRSHGTKFVVLTVILLGTFVAVVVYKKQRFGGSFSQNASETVEAASTAVSQGCSCLASSCRRLASMGTSGGRRGGGGGDHFAPRIGSSTGSVDAQFDENEAGSSTDYVPLELPPTGSSTANEQEMRQQQSSSEEYQAPNSNNLLQHV